jgi:macrolide transport system ATP-binding/permease protein
MDDAREIGGTPPVGAASDAPILSLRDVTKTYARGDMAVEVLKGVSFDVWPGEFVAVIGPSGSGKSTLMNLIGCLDRPTSGSYRVAGTEVTELDADGRAALRRSTFGFVFQQYNLLGTATALENVEVPAVYAGLPRAARDERGRELLGQLGLADRLDHRPNQLSGGQQQRVSVARALMNGGAVILADEPTGALDSKSGADVMALIKDLHRQGHTILLITHDAKVAREANRVVEISDGEIVTDTRVAGPEARNRWQRPEGEAAHMPPPRAAPRFARPAPALAAPLLLPLAETARLAFNALRVNFIRTLLTLLGIIIGVASVVTMLAVGNGAKQQVLDRITAMGTNLLLVRAGAPNQRFAGGFRGSLMQSDADAIAELPNVAHTVPEFPFNATVRFGTNDHQTQLTGTTPNYAEARSWPLASGVFFDQDDMQAYAPVVVLGETVANALFTRGEEPLGQHILVNNNPFLVIGVMYPKGANDSGQDMDDMMFTPLTTGRLRSFGQRFVRAITVAVTDLERIDDTQEAVRQLLISRHSMEDFQIRNMSEVMEAADETQDTLTVMLGSIAAIALLVGGIGVMNIMLVSVTERTREIGIRMATGARRIDILLQFATEALVVCAVGGALGVLLGVGATFAFEAFGKPILISLGPMVLAFACAFGTGVVFGYLPARRAADLDPVTALGSE